VLQDVVHENVLGIPADLILWSGVAALATVPVQGAQPSDR